MENNLLAISSNLYKRALRLMGNMFEISVLAKEEKHAAESFEAAIAEMQRIERLLTTFYKNVIIDKEAITVGLNKSGKYS